MKRTLGLEDELVCGNGDAPGASDPCLERMLGDAFADRVANGSPDILYAQLHAFVPIPIQWRRFGEPADVKRVEQ